MFMSDIKIGDVVVCAIVHNTIMGKTHFFARRAVHSIFLDEFETHTFIVVSVLVKRGFHTTKILFDRFETDKGLLDIYTDSEFILISR